MFKFSADQKALLDELIAITLRLRSSGELRRAEELLVQAYEEGTRIFGSHHGEVGRVLLMLTEVCEQQGKMQLAAEYRYKVDKIAALYRLDAEH